MANGTMMQFIKTGYGLECQNQQSIPRGYVTWMGMGTRPENLLVVYIAQFFQIMYG